MQGVRSVSSWGTQIPHPYDETNKKFILSIDVIFLESYKKDKYVERKLDHMDRFTRLKTYHEFDDEIPRIEGGIPILGQYLEYPFEEPSSPLLKNHLPLMKNFLPLHRNLRFSWMM
jgi:hypothetical protein